MKRNIWHLLALLVLATGLIHCSGKAPESKEERAVTALPRTAGGPRADAAVHASPPDLLVRATVGEMQLTLDQCTLSYVAGGRPAFMPLSIPGSCSFVVNPAGVPQVVVTEWGSSLMVVSSQPIPGSVEKSGRQECDTYLKGVLVNGEQVHVSSSTQHVLACGRGPWDETMFRVFANESHP